MNTYKIHILYKMRIQIGTEKDIEIRDGIHTVEITGHWQAVLGRWHKGNIDKAGTEQYLFKVMAGWVSVNDRVVEVYNQQQVWNLLGVDKNEQRIWKYLEN